MAVFDVSFANKNTKAAGKDYGFLIDRLDIMENQMSADGKLSPGDYDLLNAEAQRIYGYPGLTPAQRSNIAVKMSSYSSKKIKDVTKDQNDIAMLNRELEDDGRTASMLHGNNPKNFLTRQVKTQEARIASLSNAIDNLDAAGDDASAHMNEYNTALADYQESLAALAAVEGHQIGAAPNSGFAAYITTNNQGEIIDVKVKREGAQSGYLETNGLYGGLKIYGKLNRKESGQNVFVLGNDTFRANDFMSVDPVTGAVKSAPLLSSRTTGGKNFGIVKPGSSQFVDMDPVSTKTQSAIRSGGYVQGEKFIYQKNADGKYTKFVNSSPEALKIKDTDIIRVPRSFESSITPMVTKTIDGVAPPPLPQPPATQDAYAPNVASVPQTPRLPGLGGGPVQPTPSAGSRITSVAANAVKSAAGYLGKLFGQ